MVLRSGTTDGFDGRPPNAQARRSRTLRIRNLPPDTQEGLLQQVLEKHAKVVRLEVFAKKHEAVVELSSPVVRGSCFPLCPGKEI